MTNGRVVAPSNATWLPGPMPQACRAAAMPRAPSWRRDHSTRSQPSAPADAMKVIARCVSAVASSRGRSEADWLTNRIDRSYPGWVTGKRHLVAAGPEETGAGRATSAPSARAASSASVVVAPVGHDAGAGHELGAAATRLGVDLHVDDHDVGAGGILGRPR